MWFFWRNIFKRWKVSGYLLWIHGKCTPLDCFPTMIAASDGILNLQPDQAKVFFGLSTLRHVCEGCLYQLPVPQLSRTLDLPVRMERHYIISKGITGPG